MNERRKEGRKEGKEEVEEGSENIELVVQGRLMTVGPTVAEPGRNDVAVELADTKVAQQAEGEALGLVNVRQQAVAGCAVHL